MSDEAVHAPVRPGMEFFHYRKLLRSAVERQDKDRYIVVRSAKNREARLGAVAELDFPLERVGHAWLVGPHLSVDGTQTRYFCQKRQICQ